jgi:hypothetical protein
MTRWVEAFRHPTGTIIHKKVEDTSVTVTRTSNRDTCTLAAAFSEEHGIATFAVLGAWSTPAARIRLSDEGRHASQ